MKAARTTNIAEIRSLTGVRGVAACLVVLYHYFQDSPGLLGPAFRIVKHGYIGVDLFFVLSGFVMALTYGRSFDRHFSFGTYLSFLGKRLGRVYPLYLFVTLAVVVCVSVGAIAGEPASLGTIASNLALMQAWGLAPSIGGPTWSISTEFAAYLLFPALVLAVLSGRAYAAIAAAIGAVLAVLALANLDTATLHQVYLGVPDRSGPLDISGTGTVFPLIRCLAGFILGLAAFRFWRDRPASRLVTWRWSGDVVALVVLGLLCVRDSDVGLEVAFVALVVTLAASRSWMSAAMGSRVIFWLGEISYSIYLVHRPIEELIRNPFIDVLNRHGVPHAYTVAAFVPLLLVIPLSALTYYGIERPARNWSRRAMGMSRRSVQSEPSAP